MSRGAPLPRPWTRLALLIAITAVGGFLRLHRIEGLPPAEGYDAAYYGVDALELLGGEPPRVMYPPNREPLFSYLVAASFLAFGASKTAIHLASAAVGILTVPTVYLAADALFQEGERPLRRWAPLLSALMVALSYWHLNWSRLGVRAILVPLLSAGVVAALWRGLVNRRPWLLVVSGTLLGLSMYTYQAARLLPVLVAAAFATSAAKRGSVTRQDWRQLLIVAGVTALVFAPLGAHFLTHPGSFSRRVEEALVVQPGEAGTDNLAAVLGQTAETLLAFSIQGDETPYSTIPGRPSLNPFLSGLLILGILVSLATLKRPNRVVLLVWLALMFVPGALAGKGPTAKRAIGTLPAVALLIALGALAPWTDPLRRFWGGRRTKATARPADPVSGPTQRLRALWILGVAVGFVWTGWVTYRDYFIVWGSNPNLPEHFEADVSAVGDYIGALPEQEVVYLSPELPSHPSIRFRSGLREDVRGYNGRVCLAAPGNTKVSTTYVILTGEGDGSLQRLERVFPQGAVGSVEGTGGERGSFFAYRIPSGAELQEQPVHALRATWADSIALLGYGLETDEGQGAPRRISLTLTYQALGEIEQRYTAFVHVLGSANPETGSPLWAQHDGEPCRGFYPTTSWHEGEVLIDRIELQPSNELPPGTYTLGTGFYDVWTGERLPLKSGAAPTDHDVLILHTFEVGGWP